MRFNFKFFVIFISVLIVIALISYLVDQKQRSDFLAKVNTLMQTQDLAIDNSAPVLMRQEIFINASVEQVWDTLTSIKDWVSWQSDITDIQINNTPRKNVSFSWNSNGTHFNSTIHTSKQYDSFGWIGTTFGAQAIHNWYFIREQNGTKVIVEESLDGFIIQLFTNHFKEVLLEGLNKNLNELKVACENEIIE